MVPKMCPDSRRQNGATQLNPCSDFWETLFRKIAALKINSSPTTTGHQLPATRHQALAATATTTSHQQTTWNLKMKKQENEREGKRKETRKQKTMAHRPGKRNGK